MLVVKLQILGLDISRGSVARIESRLVHVSEYKLLYFTRAFKVEVTDLFPSIETKKPIHDAVSELMQRRKTRKSS